MPLAPVQIIGQRQLAQRTRLTLRSVVLRLTTLPAQALRIKSRTVRGVVFAPCTRGLGAPHLQVHVAVNKWKR
jgi:hypothetical protein